MIRYYKLFDLLNRRGMKKSDLRKIISPKTVAKLSKGEYVSGEVIDKICLFLHCQPSDIMEVVDNVSVENDVNYSTTDEVIDHYVDSNGQGHDVVANDYVVRDNETDEVIHWEREERVIPE